MSHSRPNEATTLTLIPNESQVAHSLTVICYGTVRGGTTAVAGTLHRLGVHMGDDLPPNFEDPSFSRTDILLTRQSIANRNRRFGVWGFKDPNAARYIDGIFDDFRNPVFLIVDRDIVASANRILRRDNRTRKKLLQDILRQKQRNIDIAFAREVPTILISYEKLVTYPENFVSELCEFLGMEFPEQIEELTGFLRPGKYKSEGI